MKNEHSRYRDNRAPEFVIELVNPGVEISLSLDDNSEPFRRHVVHHLISAPCAHGDIVVIDGSDFTGTTDVWINGVRVDSYIVDSDTQITAVCGRRRLHSSS